MKPEDIKISDLARILFGESPPVFFLEVFVRVMVLFLLLFVAMRIMGKKMTAMLTLQDFTFFVCLAASIGVPLQVPDRGLLPAIILVFIVVFFHQGLSKLAAKKKTIKKLMEGEPVILIKNACLDTLEMKRQGLSQERVFAMLRSQSVRHLGEVHRLYLECNGKVTIYKNPQPGPGLTVLPEFDQKFLSRMSVAKDIYACKKCGFIKTSVNSPQEKCPLCQYPKWMQAVA